MGSREKSFKRIVGHAEWDFNRLDKRKTKEQYTYIKMPKRDSRVFRMINSVPNQELLNWDIPREIIRSWPDKIKFLGNRDVSGKLKFIGKGAQAVVKFAVEENNQGCTLCAAKKIKVCAKNITGRQWRKVVTECRLQSKAGDLALSVIDAVLTKDHKENVQIIIFMELSLGVVLDRFLRISPTSCSNLVDKKFRKRVAKKVIDTCLTMHARNVFHRDLKGQNMIVKGDYEAFDLKIIDFGHASENIMEECGYFDISLCSAPEMMEDSASSPAMDIFSIGVLLFDIIGDCSEFVLDEKFPAQCCYHTFDEGSKGSIGKIIKDKVNKYQFKPQGMLEIMASMVSMKPEDRPSLDEVKILFDEWDYEYDTWT